MVGAVVLGTMLGAGCATDQPPPDPPEPEISAWAVDDARVRIGELAGDDAYHFVEIGDAVRLDDGGIVVADAGAGRVRHFDASGRFVSEWGGPGSGPGEFARPVQIAVLDGVVSVWDEGHWRLEQFDVRGEHLGSAGLGLGDFVEASLPPLHPRSVRFLGPTGWAIELISKAEETKTATKAETTAGSPGAGIMRGSADLARTTLLARLEGDEEVVVEAPWGPQPIAPPLARGPRMGIDPHTGRICAGDAYSPRVTCFAPDGTESVVTWATPEVGVARGDPEIARWMEETRALYEPKIAPETVDELLAQVPAPNVRPPFVGLHVDRQGYLWVEIGVGTDNGAAGASPGYRVFAPSGTPVGAVSMPSGRLLDIGRDYLLVERLDDIGVSYVELRDLIRETDPEGAPTP